MGERVCQGGSSHQPREALRAAEVRRSASAMGGRAYTFSWLGQNRRMSKDYERLAATSETFVYVAMSRLMVRRLARA